MPLPGQLPHTDKAAKARRGTAWQMDKTTRRSSRRLSFSDRYPVNTDSRFTQTSNKTRTMSKSTRTTISYSFSEDSDLTDAPSDDHTDKAIQTIVSPKIRSQAASKDRARFISAIGAFLKDDSQENSDNMYLSARCWLNKMAATDEDAAAAVLDRRKTNESELIMYLLNGLQTFLPALSSSAWKKIQKAMLSYASAPKWKRRTRMSYGFQKHSFASMSETDETEYSTGTSFSRKDNGGDSDDSDSDYPEVISQDSTYPSKHSSQSPPLIGSDTNVNKDAESSPSKSDKLAAKEVGLNPDQMEPTEGEQPNCRTSPLNPNSSKGSSDGRRYPTRKQSTSVRSTLEKIKDKLNELQQGLIEMIDTGSSTKWKLEKIHAIRDMLAVRETFEGDSAVMWDDEATHAQESAATSTRRDFFAELEGDLRDVLDNDDELQTLFAQSYSSSESEEKVNDVDGVDEGEDVAPPRIDSEADLGNEELERSEALKVATILYGMDPFRKAAVDIMRMVHVQRSMKPRVRKVSRWDTARKVKSMVSVVRLFRSPLKTPSNLDLSKEAPASKEASPSHTPNHVGLPKETPDTANRSADEGLTPITSKSTRDQDICLFRERENTGAIFNRGRLKTVTRRATQTMTQPVTRQATQAMSQSVTQQESKAMSQSVTRQATQAMSQSVTRSMTHSRSSPENVYLDPKEKGKKKVTLLTPASKKPVDRISAEKYLASHGIYELFQFMLTNLVAQRPDQPLDYLIDMTRTINKNAQNK